MLSKFYNVSAENSAIGNFTACWSRGLLIHLLMLDMIFDSHVDRGWKWADNTSERKLLGMIKSVMELSRERNRLLQRGQQNSSWTGGTGIQFVMNEVLRDTPVTDGPATVRCVEFGKSFLETPVTVCLGAERFEIKKLRACRQIHGVFCDQLSGYFWTTLCSG